MYPEEGWSHIQVILNFQDEKHFQMKESPTDKLR